ncbi:ATP-binding protein, partial [Escherichia albertii]|uniref:ATP-binding protein n=1 Tax=Escherichia albertii TaxID=208962 RepID=UPI00224FF9A4
VFSDQASIASWALFSLHRKKLYEYRNANGVKISVKMSSPEHYTTADAILDRLVHNSHRVVLQGESLRKNPPVVESSEKTR